MPISRRQFIRVLTGGPILVAGAVSVIPASAEDLRAPALQDMIYNVKPWGTPIHETQLQETPLSLQWRLLWSKELKNNTNDWRNEPLGKER